MKRGLLRRKSQVTIFIIIAIILIVIISVLIFVLKGDKEAESDVEYFSQANIKPEVSKIQSNILDCTEDITKEALDVIGIQGGFYERPEAEENYFDFEWAFIPYYYNEGKYLMPPKVIIQRELSKNVEDNLNICLDDLRYSDFNLVYDQAQVKTQIKETEVEFTINLPINIERENKRITLELGDYPITHPSALYDIIEVASYYTESHKGDNYMICISCLADMCEEKDLYMHVIDLTEVSTLVVISENYTSSNTYSFEFINKYTGNEAPDPSDVPGIPASGF